MRLSATCPGQFVLENRSCLSTPGVSNRRSSSTPSELFASDEESIISSVSGQSVSSYVEIDSDQNVIKYKRPRCSSAFSQLGFDH